MADQAISSLTAVTAPSSTDVVPIVNAGATKKVTIANLVKLGNSAIWARAYHNTSQSIANSTATTLAFNSERYDTDTIHDPSTNNERLTCKTAGIYLISATVQFQANATGYRSLSLAVNGTISISGVVQPATAGGIVTQINVGGIYPLAVNDYVIVQASQTSGGVLAIDFAANYSPEFMMVRLGG